MQWGIYMLQLSFSLLLATVPIACFLTLVKYHLNLFIILVWFKPTELKGLYFKVSEHKPVAMIADPGMKEKWDITSWFVNSCDPIHIHFWSHEATLFHWSIKVRKDYLLWQRPSDGGLSHHVLPDPFLKAAGSKNGA